jgi:hypothetical protein
MKYIVITFLIVFSTYTTAAKWSYLLEQDGIKIFSGKSEKSGVIPFKAIGVVNADIKTVLNVLLDHQRKSEWSPKLDYVKMHDQLSRNLFIFSEYYRTPWPATDREFLLKGKISIINNDHIKLLAKSINDKNYSDDRYIQTDVKYLNLHIKKVSKIKTEVTFTFHGDMKGWMPVWLMNLIQKKWPLRFIQGLRKQVSLENIESHKIFNELESSL